MATPAPDPITLRLRPPHPRQISLAQAKHYATRKHPSVSAQLVAYFNELSRLCHLTGYDFGVLVAQSAEETATWTSNDWTQRCNPAGIGHDDDLPAGVKFANGTDAARAHLVHMAAYVEGGLILDSPLTVYQSIDPTFCRVSLSGFGGTVKTLADLGNGKWATDKNYATAIAAVYGAMLAAPAVSTPAPAAPPAALLPPITWVPGCGNFHTRPGGMKPVAIVRHITDDMSLQNVLNWFVNPSSQASAHFVIDREEDPNTGYAKVYQLVGSGDAAWTNGDYATLVNGVWRLNEWRTDIPWLNDAIAQCRAGTHNLNDFTIGIEHVGTPDIPPTKAQYKSSIALGNYFCDPRVYGIGRSRGRNLRHGDIDHIDRSYCPGPDFDLAGVIKAQGGDPLDLAS